MSLLMPGEKDAGRGLHRDRAAVNNNGRAKMRDNK
jgi:hypothetical protein